MTSAWQRKWVLRLIVGIMLVAILLSVSAWILPLGVSGKTIPPPEAQSILGRQAEVPFQILIPAYLPAGFQRKDVEIRTDLTDPQGRPLVQLIYTHPRGVQLTLNEWMSETSDASNPTNTSELGISQCYCLCRNGEVCQADHWMIDNGLVRVMGETSNPEILSSSHIQLILGTLAPAGGMLTYTSIQNLPVLPGLPPAEEISVNASGVQEVVLVISPTGYTPVHFSVKVGVPVRLTFHQLGDVGCGNELDFQWGDQQTSHLVLTDPTSSQVLEFTPQEGGDFLFHCPHLIYQGVMTVIE
jgi:hypothetical protein